MPEPLNLAEGRLQAVPLRLVLFAAFCDGEWVGELGVVLPELQLGEGRAACEEIEDLRPLAWVRLGCCSFEGVRIR